MVSRVDVGKLFLFIQHVPHNPIRCDVAQGPKGGVLLGQSGDEAIGNLYRFVGSPTVEHDDHPPEAFSHVLIAVEGCG